MTSQEANEYHATKLRVAFGAGESIEPDALLRKKLLEQMGERRAKPFIPLEIAVVEFTDILFNNPDLNKIHSISLDGLEFV